MLNCKQISESGDDFLAGDLGVYQNIKIRIHLVMCRYCRRYVRQLKVLIKGIQKLNGNSSAAEIDKVMQKIRNRIKDRNQ